MAPDPQVTRERLVAAAERLFAERGVEGVSAREITAAAGVRNATALQYHYGNREGLLRAVLRKHHVHVEAQRHALLDAYEAAPDRGLRLLVGAFVRPAAAKLADPDGGREYLRIVAHLLNRPDVEVLRPADPGSADSTDRWRALVEPHLTDVAVHRLHRRFTAIRITFVELARRAERPPARDDRLFTSHLVDLATALLEAPLSEETANLLASAPGPGMVRP